MWLQSQIFYLVLTIFVSTNQILFKMINQDTLPKPPATSIDELPQSLQHIANSLEKSRILTPAEMRNLVLEASVEEEDILPWSDFGHPMQDSYGRNMIYKGDHYEIMAMSWQPGDFSGIHDHGHTEWGAVQVFGPAEHATFDVENEVLSTTSRFIFTPKDVVGVSHELIHQMGNATQEPFLTLHVYGQPEDIESVTGDARVYELKEPHIQRVDGGVFFALPTSEIKRVESCAAPDFTTRLRYLIELVKRLDKMVEAKIENSEVELRVTLEALFNNNQHLAFNNHLSSIRTQEEKLSVKKQLDILRWELEVAVELQNAMINDLPENACNYEAMLESL